MKQMIARVLPKVLIGFLVLGSAGVASAAGTPIRDARTALASTTKEAREEAMASTTARIEKRLENRYDKMDARFGATIDRLNSIMTRINSRIEKNLQDARNDLAKAIGSLMGKSQLHATTTDKTKAVTPVNTQ